MLNRKPASSWRLRQQKGAALITSLIILLILTVLGVAAMSGSSLQEMMSGNLSDQNTAFDAAEAALRDGERHVESWTVIRPDAATTATASEVYARFVIACLEEDGCPFDTGVWGNYTNLGWSGATTSGLAQTYGGGQLSSTAPPLYIIEEKRYIASDAGYRSQVRRSGITLYRITARGSGLSPNSVIILQSTYGKRFF